MKKTYLFLILCLACFPLSELSAQTDNKISISGTVMDEKGEELPGVSIFVKESPTTRAVADIEGRFKISNIQRGHTLVFRFVGFADYEYLANETKEKLRIGMKQNVSDLQQVVVVAHGTQRKITTTGAVSTVNVKELQIPATSVSNMIGGRVPGVIAVSRSGEPGNDFSEFWIRGISTFGASSAALVLIDGVEGNLNNIDPTDIESFSVLKDASATAVYGNRGANGVVIITTKRGKAGTLKVNFKANSTYSYSARQPDYVNSYDYGRLANEARLGRGQSLAYTSAELELFRTGLDPDLYPNVDWRDVILKDGTRFDQYNLNLSGGGTNARYYMSVGLLNKPGLFNQDKRVAVYDANSNYRKLNFRANIDVNLTKTTELGLNLDDAVVRNNTPGGGQVSSQNLWDAQLLITPNVAPVRYSSGEVAAFGQNGNSLTPYYLLNYMGYNKLNSNVANVKLNLRQDLSSITKGLTANALASFTYNSNHTASLTKQGAEAFRPSLNGGRANDGTLMLRRTVNFVDANYGQPTSSSNQTYIEARVNYARTFNTVHNVGGLVHVYRQQDGDSRADYDYAYQNVIPVRYQALSGRATYGYKDTYLLEANVGISGSENFRPGEQYGIFPAFSAGWVPSNYQWWKDKLSFVNLLKFRGSWGRVGNASIRNTATNRQVRFPYQTIIVPGASDWGGSYIESRIGTEGLKWQTTTKANLGLDLKLLDNRIDIVTDIFTSRAEDIYQQRVSIPEEVGAAQNPWLNSGSMKSWGVDGTVAYSQDISKSLSFTLRSNFTITRNKVTHWEQSGLNFPYQSFSGVPLGVQRGLIAMGLFKDEADIANSPTQTFMSNYMPGDIKYRDVNNDGIINNDDEVPLRYSNVPRLLYGFAGSLSWKKWNFNIFFTGQDQVSYFLGGTGYYPFMGENFGNVLQIVADDSNRWIPASVSGDPSTENPDARFPRLTYGSNANNNRSSTFWLADASFLRLKNAEIGYSFDYPWLKRKMGISSVNLSLIGDNLAVWDKVKLWDPEQASANGARYPLQRMYTLQMYLNF